MAATGTVTKPKESPKDAAKVDLATAGFSNRYSLLLVIFFLYATSLTCTVCPGYWGFLPEKLTSFFCFGYCWLGVFHCPVGTWALALCACYLHTAHLSTCSTYSVLLNWRNQRTARLMVCLQYSPLWSTWSPLCLFCWSCFVLICLCLRMRPCTLDGGFIWHVFGHMDNGLKLVLF